MTPNALQKNSRGRLQELQCDECRSLSHQCAPIPAIDCTMALVDAAPELANNFRATLPGRDRSSRRPLGLSICATEATNPKSIRSENKAAKAPKTSTTTNGAWLGHPRGFLRPSNAARPKVIIQFLTQHGKYQRSGALLFCFIHAH